MTDEPPVTDAEVDRTALDIMRWGYRETARHMIAFQRQVRALKAEIAERTCRQVAEER